MSKYRLGTDHWCVRLAGYLERASFCYADHVIAINEPIRDLLVSRGLNVSKTTVIMNSVDEAFFVSALSTPKLHSPAATEKEFVMMYHGTLTSIYGLDIAIEAFGAVYAEMPGSQLWILGSGPEKNALVSLSRKLGLDSRVRFVGSVLPQEIPEWLRRCDVGILATRRDVFLGLSFSNKLSEYIIMGKAVISSRLKTIRHYFSEDALAFFEPNSPQDLARQMLRMYKDPDLRAKLAERARLEYEPICWGVMRGRYLKLMEDFIL